MTANLNYRETLAAHDAALQQYEAARHELHAAHLELTNVASTLLRGEHSAALDATQALGHMDFADLSGRILLLCSRVHDVCPNEVEALIKALQAKLAAVAAAREALVKARQAVDAHNAAADQKAKETIAQLTALHTALTKPKKKDK